MILTAKLSKKSLLRRLFIDISVIIYRYIRDKSRMQLLYLLMIFLLTFSMVIRFFSNIKQFKNLPSTTNFYWFTEIRDTLAGSFLPVKYDSEQNPLYFNAIFLKNNSRKSRRHLYADEKRKILELNAAKKSFAENSFSSSVIHGNSESTLKLGLPLVFQK